MKRLIDIIVAKEEGFTIENYVFGALASLSIFAVCILAEIIDAI